MYYAQPLSGAYTAMEDALLSPKRAEAQGIAALTRRMIAGFRDEGVPFSRRADLLHENRRLWYAVLLSAADADNPMPETLRAGLVSLGAFVDRSTSELLAGRGDVRVLIEINRRVVAGLATGGG
ncbi:flagellar biosynthesis regulator FlaF [Jannaschia sp. W003]|uniref:flagellar biosynthesis regulator FlaF n=1 Tax=Jannaschia sp. W003 TaxID=2867012 RepID=UPI0021A5C204|nr:flagellar biosynthesis regulator FlaF [Jannaschia sp. W003]UWQ21841.1 hypothetical protein K3554_02085 [Jannaschia sp. W003]